MNTSMLKKLATYLVSALALGLVACNPKDIHSSRELWISGMLDAQHEMSKQLLKLETDRDALAIGAEAIDCSPETSQMVYVSVTAKLKALLNEGNRLELAGSYREDIERVIDEWSALERRHNSLWSESDETPGLQAAERCLRPTSLVSTRLTIERSMVAAIKGALVQN